MSQGDSVAHVSQVMGLNKRTLYHWRLNEAPNHTQSSAGRPRKLSKRHVKWAREALMKHKLSLNDVKKRLYSNSRGKVDVSKSTILRAVKNGRVPLIFAKASKKPFLTEQHKQLRLEFASRFMDIDWDSVMFTDSKYFIFGYQPTGKLAAVWCKKGDRPKIPTVKKVKKIHVYAGISVHGVTPLFFVEGTSDARECATSVTS